MLQALSGESESIPNPNPEDKTGIMDNPALWQYINSLGIGLMGKDSPMYGPAKMTQDAMSAKAYMDVIKKFLGGGGNLSEKDGKLQYAGDITKFVSPEDGQLSSTPANFTGSSAGTPQNTNVKPQGQSMPNPSRSPLDISSADLVGLTPEHISQALQFKFAKEEMEQKKLSELYKMMQPESVEPSAPIETPGIGKLSLKQWSSLPTEDRSYFLYAASARQRGEEVMDKDSWDASTDTNTKIQYLKALEEDSELKSLAMELARAGASSTSIDIAGREVAKGEGKGQANVMSPDYAQRTRRVLSADKANWPSEELIQSFIAQGFTYEEAEVRAQDRMILESMDKEIRQAFKHDKVTRGQGGWEVNGELKVRYP